MKKNILSFLLLGWIIFLFSCQSSEEGKPLIAFENMDKSIPIEDNFFKYINGNWLKKVNIPPDKSRWGSFDELRESNQETLKELMLEAMKSDTYAEGSEKWKLIEMYKIGMDTSKANTERLKPIQPWLDKIENITEKKQIQEFVTQLHKVYGDPLFSASVFQDLKKSDQMAFYLFQGGLGLPNNEYYSDTNEKIEKIRKKYVEHIKNMFVLYGKSEEEAGKISQNIYGFEKELAKVSWTPLELRDLTKMYNKKSIVELKGIVPFIDWGTYLNQLGIANEDSIIVAQPDFMEAMAGIVEKTDIGDIKNYLIWNLLSNSAPYLSKDFIEENFNFYSKDLYGTKELKKQWKRVISTVENGIGFALGKLYIEKKFPKEAKEKADKLVSHLLDAFKTRIENVEWMSDSTKEQALKKLSTFKVKIGYPNKWRDYSELKSADTYWGFVMNSKEFEFNRNINKLGKPVDVEEWSMVPHQVNAYYHPLHNEIVFPAGILQPPFYNYKADEAINYGGIGMVIGHEITHGFDDRGSQFDAEGNMRNWWNKTDRENFMKRANKIVEQYNQFNPIDTMHINGALTLGENIADLGGLTVAYDALQLFYKENGRPDLIDSLTAEQRFFMSCATIWRVKSTDESLRTSLKNNVHSPGEYRANGPLSNFEPFFEAFDIPEESPMRRKEIITIW